jgi:hypothetical protein
MARKREQEADRARDIDWSGAEFGDGALTVDLKGDGGKGWSKDFSGVLALLEQSSHGWGKVALKGSRIRVSDVQAGSEEELRHFLESVVLQVNSDLGLQSETTGDDDGADEAQAHAQQQEAAERRMAATFRRFADGGS